MDNIKEKLLNETYNKFIQISLSDFPMEGMEEFIDQKIMGYGTTVDEKILSIDGYRESVNRQREQGKDIEMTLDTTPVYHRISEDGNSALYVDEILISLHLENNPFKIFFRISTVLEYREGKWIVVHWHGSKPEYDEGGTDTWHINEWQQKTDELERKVAEKTADLETKNRELEIEASLERVRTVAMGMNKPDDLLSICEVSFLEFQKLGFDNLRNTIIHIFNDERGFFTDHDYSDYNKGAITNVDYNADPVVVDYLKQIKSSKDAFVEIVVNRNKLDDWKKFREKIGDYYDKRLNNIDALYYYFYSIDKGAIGISNFKPFTEAQLKILKRFRNVFDLAYRRYNDIALAEAQARESRVQLALERVRARTMAMHNSEELSETSFVLFEQLRELGQVAEQISIIIYNQQERVIELYATIYGSKWEEIGKIPFDENIVHRNIYNAWKKRLKSLVIDLSGEELDEFNKFKMKYSTQYKSEKEVPKDRWVMHYAFFSKGALTFSTHEPQPPETIQLLERFASVFDLTYTRFLDLKKAEAQAREANIEAALERVRSRAMSMNTPGDLTETVSLFFKELKALNVLPWRCGVGRIEEETRTTYLTTTSITKDGKIKEVAGELKQTGHPVLDGIFDNWKLQKEYYPVLHGNDINKYYSIIKPQIAYPDYPLDAVQYGHNIPFKEGFIFAWTENRLSEDELRIFRRFGSVLSLTYRRYMELMEAEARAAESTRQAALDRVRAEIASMRTSEDLNRITPIIWRELKILEVPFIRCGVFIVDEDNKKVQVYLTTPDGKSLGALLLTFNANKLTSSTIEYWKKKQIYKEHWNREEFLNWTKLLIDTGQVQNAETYQGSSEPPEALYLHFVPFTQGMLYVGDVSPLSEDKLQLVKTLAEAFSIAYARYEDFKNIEGAKNKIEATLNELKAAQAQLVHSEKMASLGELTAGIAHEIKNPLNFVNNFSEVSRELLDEMKTELKNKNNEEVVDLIEDLKQNLEKINQHGSRADSIIKGMLLHSRGSSGEKTPTDINDLLDQYVNLAYHGMRAQNKEFNISIEKDYDKTLEKINVVPQDISRVFLNIINNACYAAFDKKKKSGNNFSPALKVSTKDLNGTVEIRIEDNGNGIPASVKEQIFNPFFSTKPTGEGTGLGLSLSYDIVAKVHGGKIKFESEEGKHTEFIITLPKK